MSTVRHFLTHTESAWWIKNIAFRNTVLSSFLGLLYQVTTDRVASNSRSFSSRGSSGLGGPPIKVLTGRESFWNFQGELVLVFLLTSGSFWTRWCSVVYSGVTPNLCLHSLVGPPFLSVSSLYLCLNILLFKKKNK